jgi:hypothetical protein
MPLKQKGIKKLREKERQTFRQTGCMYVCKGCKEEKKYII